MKLKLLFYYNKNTLVHSMFYLFLFNTFIDFQIYYQVKKNIVDFYFLLTKITRSYTRFIFYCFICNKTCKYYRDEKP